MSDLNIKFSSENDNKKLNTSLDLRINNGQFEKVEKEKPKPPVEEILKEEYFENLFEEKSALSVETAEEITPLYENDKPEETVFETEETVVSDEIPETDEVFSIEDTVNEEKLQPENEIIVDIETEILDNSEEDETFVNQDYIEEASPEEEITELQETGEVFEADEENSEEIVEEIEVMSEETSDDEGISAEGKIDLSDEKEMLADANTLSDDKNETDGLLGEMSFDTQKGKYDFINLCVLLLMLVFVSLTFVLMKQQLTSEEKNELSAKTLKTGEYTNNISEKYYKNLPMEKIMAQGEIIVKWIFGERDLKFIKYKDNEPPDGPVDDSNVGGMIVEDEEQVTVTTKVTETGEVTTTAKLPQDFEITTSEQKTDNSPVFTGRPIKTTTTKVTTTLDLPQTTKDTTTGKVELIFP